MYKIEEITNKILCGDALQELKKIPSDSINTICTSPPYWALRDYSTAKWIGSNNPICAHLNAKEKSNLDFSLNSSPIQKPREGTDAPRWKEVCPDCNAKKIDLQIGLEPTIKEYINKLCDIFDEVKRVLKKEGTCWVNIGDSYYTKTGSGFQNDNLSTTTNINGIESANQLRAKGEIAEKNLCLVPHRFAIKMVEREMMDIYELNYGFINQNIFIVPNNPDHYAVQGQTKGEGILERICEKVASKKQSEIQRDNEIVAREEQTQGEGIPQETLLF